ncbi:MAG TPA: ATP-binding cassette domain-containing protein [Spirochaetia bacterium]|nr:ATP-binding cassette domain-containing protein [Spirochaetia bacterium]
MRVELRNIHKTFGQVHANRGITLDIPSSSIQGILGENGAGKSTLMKILSGFILPDSGEIALDGRTVVIQSPANAIRHGIGMLHQDPLDFPPMKLVDNFILGRPGHLFPDRRGAARDMRELASQFDFALDPDAYVDTLTVGERQQLEILRLLWLGAHVLILDEPTTGISQPQKEKLFATLKTLASRGVTIVFVSHKLEDVEYLCSQVAVFRQGELVGAAAPPYKTRELVRMMFGREVSFGGRRSGSPGSPVLSLERVCLEGVRLQIQDVTLEARAGEVIGLAGMEGSGQSIFLSACAGLTRPVAGRIGLGHRDVTGQSHHSFKRQGVVYLPAARLERGLVPGLTLTEHFVLSEGGRGFFIDRRSASELATERIQTFNIKGLPTSTVESLSGGNQQRMLLALLRTPLSLILLEHPTRGLDIESTMYVWSKLKERCSQGTSIVFISADLDEVMQYSDRVIVFFAGRVSPPLPAGSLSVTELGELIGGKGWERFTQEGIRA